MQHGRSSILKNWHSWGLSGSWIMPYIYIYIYVWKLGYRCILIALRNTIVSNTRNSWSGLITNWICCFYLKELLGFLRVWGFEVFGLVVFFMVLGLWVFVWCVGSFQGLGFLGFCKLCKCSKAFGVLRCLGSWWRLGFSVSVCFVFVCDVLVCLMFLKLVQRTCGRHF